MDKNYKTVFLDFQIQRDTDDPHSNLMRYHRVPNKLNKKSLI